MKKLIISAILFTLACISMAAQDHVFNNPDNKPYFGVRIAYDMMCPGNIDFEDVKFDFFKGGSGFEFGGIFNLPVVANFYIEPGLKLFYGTYSMKKDWLEVIQDDIILNSLSIRKFGMRVPLMLGYHFDILEGLSLSVFTGPELEVGFSAKERIKGHNIESSESVYGDDGGMKRVNILWNAGIRLSSGHFYFDVTCMSGLVNMLKDSEMKFKEHRSSFGIGYNF